MAVVAPAGPGDVERLDLGLRMLMDWGLRPLLGENALNRDGYLAGSDADRLADLDAALRSDEVRGIIATRGGYGTQRIVDAAPLELLRDDPKLIVGFSDLTALHLAVWRRAGCASLHAPGIAWDSTRLGEACAESLRAAMMSCDPVVLRPHPYDPVSELSVAGEASGVLLGGNLSMLCSSVGTPDMADLSGAILLLEEVNEAPYRIDRMLLQLRRAGCLDGLAGVALGQFTNCLGLPEQQDTVDVLRSFLAPCGVPIAAGLPVGHGPGQLSVPLGVPARIAGGTLTVEAAVS